MPTSTLFPSRDRGTILYILAASSGICEITASAILYSEDIARQGISKNAPFSLSISSSVKDCLSIKIASMGRPRRLDSFIASFASCAEIISSLIRWSIKSCAFEDFACTCFGRFDENGVTGMVQKE